MKTVNLSGRVPEPVREILREHAARCGRTVSREAALWARFGAACSVLAELHEAGHCPENEALRDQAAEDMARLLSILLPHRVQSASVWERVQLITTMN